jgi:hypothetical protein
MRIVEIRERTVPLSRYADPAIPSDGLDTSVVALVTDERRDGAPVVGFGFSSIGRFAQGELIRERFAPRLLAAREGELASPSGGALDPVRAWDCMMTGAKRQSRAAACAHRRRRASASSRARPFAICSARASRPRRPSGCADACAGLPSHRTTKGNRPASPSSP